MILYGHLYCTSRGHSSAAAAANCPACRNRGSYNKYYGSGYAIATPNQMSSSKQNVASHSGQKRKASWSSANSTVLYTPKQIKMLTPLRNAVEKRAEKDLKDVFLCHAWDDRKTIALNLNNLLTVQGTSVWFSETEVKLGTSLHSEIDKGLANSRIGIVLVTPAFLKRIQGNGIADRELSALLYNDQLIPVLDGVTFEELRDVSPLLASRSGLSTSEETMEEIVAKLAEVAAI